MNQPYVVAGCPARDRAWIIDRHLAAIYNQADQLFYLVNDCTDDTQRRLLRSAVAHEVLNTNHPGYARTGEHRYHDDQHANLARLRNHWIERALELYPQATHFWMVDSDVVPDPDCLEKLLAADKDIVAGVVRNGDSAYNFMIGPPCGHTAGEPWRDGREGLLLTEKWHGLEPDTVSLLGACVLVRRRVLEEGPIIYDYHPDGVGPIGPSWEPVRFGPHPRGEDFPWCSAAKAAGFDLWLHPLARTTHHMSETEALR